MPDNLPSKNVTSQPPSQPTSLIGGNLREFWRDKTGFLMRQAAMGDVTYMKFGPQPAFFVNNPEMIRDMFVVHADKFRKGRALQRSKTMLGNGLLTNEGAAHLRQRRMIQPAFHRNRIAEYAKSMVEYADKTANSWHDGEVRDIDKEMMHLTLEIVGKTLFNTEVGEEANEIGAAMTTLVELFNFLLLPFPSILKSSRCRIRSASNGPERHSTM